MKNSLSKTLLCGVMASTFLLINCQKAPSRGVKADAGGGAAATEDIQTKLAGKVVAECTDSFLKPLEEARVARMKIDQTMTEVKAGKKTLTEADKTEIAKIRQDIIDRNALVKTEMSQMKNGEKAAEACMTKDKKQGSLFEEVIGKMATVISELGIAVGADDEAQKTALEERKERDRKVTEAIEKQVSIGMKLVVSKELAEALKTANKNGVVYFKYNSIVTQNSSYETDKKDTSKTICELRDISADEGSLAASDEVIVNVAEASRIENERAMYKVRLGKGDVFYTIYCMIAKGKEKVMSTEFRNAFGENLLTQKQIDAKKAKVTGDAKSNLEKAKAELVVKAKAFDDAQAAKDKVQAEIDAKDKEIAAANENKDNTRVKNLNEEKIVLDAKLGKANLDLAAAQDQKAQAEKKVENAELAAK